MVVLATIIVAAVAVFLIKDEYNCCNERECWKCPFPCEDCKNCKQKEND